ncbi:hypothetical protein GOP47_0014147 [Adiantum capillus-veneris]|uniref:Uncharacterized protein n=1 Tax=Adiantum capillus-veneris TaxID=13818 RepID=A0A9D4UQK6_ADICA|nr:hypothetical protein GOP47_0014147 [Adiantum capillus-veneris]
MVESLKRNIYNDEAALNFLSRFHALQPILKVLAACSSAFERPSFVAYPSATPVFGPRTSTPYSAPLGNPQDLRQPMELSLSRPMELPLSRLDYDLQLEIPTFLPLYYSWHVCDPA